MRMRLVNARLLTLLALIRSSGELRYGREIALSELHRRIVSLIGSFEGLTSVELVALTGQEKAQISRAVAALSRDGLAVRARLRAPVTLTPAGRQVYEQIMAIGAQRDAAVTAGVARRALDRFARLTEHMTARAALLLARERERSGGDGDEAGEDSIGLFEPFSVPERLQRGGRQDPLGRMVAPRLITLSAYLSRSATIAYRRETNLSNFIWRVLSQVGEHQPLTLAVLIGLLHRDKSQVGRAVKWLEGEGLVARVPAGGREVALACTDAGNALYAGMCVSAQARDDFLFEGLKPAEHRAYLATLDVFTANGAAMLARERAAG